VVCAAFIENSPRCSMRLDLGAAAAEGAQDRRRNAGQVSKAAPHRRPLEAEAAGELDAQLGLVEIAARLGVGIEPSCVERGSYADADRRLASRRRRARRRAAAFLVYGGRSMNGSASNE
jgi:hypothetical protein